MSRVAVPGANSVFVNAPFDKSYEPLFITLVGALVFLGQEPHCVLEVRERGDGRLARIFELMRACRISIHDLSRVGTPARFNMPFELGLACALKLGAPASYEVVVLDARSYKLDRTLSDYKGRDPLIHNGTCEGMLACLLDTFASNTPEGVKEFRIATRALRKSVQLVKQSMRVNSLFRPALFRMVVAAASNIAIERGFIKPYPAG